MTSPKIKWRVELNGAIWYTIVAEVDLGSARYREMYTISQNEIDELYSISTLWKIIEKMQGNMWDALRCYENGTTVVLHGDSVWKGVSAYETIKGKSNDC